MVHGSSPALRRTTLTLTTIAWALLPANAWAKSGELLAALLVQYVWCATAATGLAYAVLSFVLGRGQPWRVAPVLAQLGLVLAATAAAFLPAPGHGHPFLWMGLVLLAEPCVLALGLRTPRQRAARVWVALAWWLPPLVLWLPGLFVLAPAIPWLESVGAALRR